LLLGQARGCCVTALVSCGLLVAEYTALQMKQSVTGHGRADKSQVQEMVKRLLQLPVVPRQDAADALGLAITHAHASPSMNKLAAQGVLNRKTHGMFRSGRSH
jgi:crossover junction endodeoxyribonuclease RuvC